MHVVYSIVPVYIAYVNNAAVPSKVSPLSYSICVVCCVVYCLR